MKRKAYTMPGKVAAMFMLVLITVFVLLEIVALVVLSENDAFFDNGVSLRRLVYENAVQDAYDDVMDLYISPKLYGYNTSSDYISELYSPENSNLFFEVTDEGGNLLYRNYSESDYRYKNIIGERTFSISESVYNGGLYWNSAEYSMDSAVLSDLGDYPISVDKGFSLSIIPSGNAGAALMTEGTDTAEDAGTPPERQVTITFTAAIREKLTAKDQVYYMLTLADFFIVHRAGIAVTCGIGIIAAILLFIYLLCSAGHHRNADGMDEVAPEALDTVPLDLYAVFVFWVSFAFAFVAVEALFFDLLSFSLLLRTVAALVCIVCIELLVLSLILTFATRVKCGKWWRTTLIYKILMLLFRICRWFFRKLNRIFSEIPALWRYAVLFAAVSLVELIVLVCTERGTVLLWWFAERIVVAFVGFFILSDWKKLLKGAKEIADGNTGYRIDVKNMYGGFKKHALCLNGINDGVQKAVNDRMKSERLKTELITNVSHDLKTPLTSIVNYVDLMKKEDIKPEKAKEYLAVLDRQSKRLQKLTIDLVEASKASTGNMPVNAEKTDIHVFLSQLSGEYEEKLAANKLELVVTSPEENVYIYADGRLMWRVFDNLMNNICKYAQENTRVYIAADVSDEKVVISFKNISRFPLNISSEELMERFVRGDTSRNTEGSGLGLSIARSLVDLQKGKFELVVDGDLFKAIVTFDRLYDDTEPKE